MQHVSNQLCTTNYLRRLSCFPALYQCYNTASMYNLTSGDNTRSLRKIVFCEFASIAMSRL